MGCSSDPSALQARNRRQLLPISIVPRWARYLRRDLSIRTTRQRHSQNQLRTPGKLKRTTAGRACERHHELRRMQFAKP